MRGEWEAQKVQIGVHLPALQMVAHLSGLASHSGAGGNRSCEAFDRCVRAAEEATGNDPVLWPEYLAGSITSALRRKYGGPRRARRRIADTHEIEQNQPVHVRLADRFHGALRVFGIE